MDLRGTEVFLNLLLLLRAHVTNQRNEGSLFNFILGLGNIIFRTSNYLVQSMLGSHVQRLGDQATVQITDLYVVFVRVAGQMSSDFSLVGTTES